MRQHKHAQDWHGGLEGSKAAKHVRLRIADEADACLFLTPGDKNCQMVRAKCDLKLLDHRAASEIPEADRVVVATGHDDHLAPGHAEHSVPGNSLFCDSPV